MDLSNVTIKDQGGVALTSFISAVRDLPVDSVTSLAPIVASAYKGVVFINTTYSDEGERDKIRFRLPKRARLILNEPWFCHAFFRPRDISRATVAAFELGGIRYTFAREYVG